MSKVTSELKEASGAEGEEGEGVSVKGFWEVEETACFGQ